MPAVAPGRATRRGEKREPKRGGLPRDGGPAWRGRTRKRREVDSPVGSLKEYETVFVLHPGLEESRIEEEIDAVRKTIEAATGEILAVDRWGKRKLAYEINKVQEGVYTLIRFRSGAEVLRDLDRRYRFQEQVLRHLTVVAQGPPPETRAAAEEPASRGEAIAEGDAAGGEAGDPVGAEQREPAVRDERDIAAEDRAEGSA